MMSDRIIRDVYIVACEVSSYTADYTPITLQLIASKNNENLVSESCDLIFHTLLLLVYKGIDLNDLYSEFEKRRG